MSKRFPFGGKFASDEWYEKAAKNEEDAEFISTGILEPEMVKEVKFDDEHLKLNKIRPQLAVDIGEGIEEDDE